MATARKYDTNGWYEIKGNPISKAGVFPYLGSTINAPDPDRIYQVYRPAEELADPDCIESFKLVPWVIEHSMLGEGETSAESKGVEGILGEDVYYKDGYLRGNIKVFSDRLADLIDSGMRELSLGYKCVYEFESGSINGEPFDAIQRKIRGNHIATVEEGRMGHEVAVLDSSTITFDSRDFQMAKKSARRTRKPQRHSGYSLDKAHDKDRMDKRAEDVGEEEMKMTLGEISNVLKSLTPVLKDLHRFEGLLKNGNGPHNGNMEEEYEEKFMERDRAHDYEEEYEEKYEEDRAHDRKDMKDRKDMAMNDRDRAHDYEEEYEEKYREEGRRNGNMIPGAMQGDYEEEYKEEFKEEDEEEYEEEFKEEDREEEYEEKFMEKDRKDMAMRDRDRGMDAMQRTINKLRRELRQVKKRQSGMDSKYFIESIARRDRLADRISHFVGSFDSSDMTTRDVALYGIKKLGIPTVPGQEIAALRAYMHNRKPERMYTHGKAQGMDSNDPDFLSKLFEGQ